MATILVIDSSPFVRENLAGFFRQHKQNAVFAATGKEAIDITGRTFPNIIVIDTHLPDMDGMELIPTLRQISPARFILTSENIPKEKAAKAIQLGIKEFLLKPLSLNALLEKIQA